MPVIHRTKIGEPGLLGRTALSRLRAMILRMDFGRYYQPRRKLDHIRDRLMQHNMCAHASSTAHARTTTPGGPVSRIDTVATHLCKNVNRSVLKSGFYVPKYRTQTGGVHRKYS